jgi:FAD/FMN-containing dehydrogenase
MSTAALVEELRRALPDCIDEVAGRAAVLVRREEELQRLIRFAIRHGAALDAPGAVARPGAVAISLQRMTDEMNFDERSLLLHVQAGIGIGFLEASLRRRGFSLGICEPVPERPLGAWLAEGAPGGPCPDDDPATHLVAGLEAVLPDGERITVHPAPRRSAGPDLQSALIGARGRLGVITAVHLLVRRWRPSRRVVFLLPTRSAAMAIRARLQGLGLRSRCARVHAIPEGGGLELYLTGSPARIEAALALATDEVARHGGVAATPEDLGPPSAPPPLEPDHALGALGEALDPHCVFGPG